MGIAIGRTFCALRPYPEIDTRRPTEDFAAVEYQRPPTVLFTSRFAFLRILRILVIIVFVFGRIRVIERGAVEGPRLQDARDAVVELGALFGAALNDIDEIEVVEVR